MTTFLLFLSRDYNLKQLTYFSTKYTLISIEPTYQIAFSEARDIAKSVC